MWFKRKPRNRRFERKHVLDVKLRSSQRRQLRLRRAALAVSVPLFLLFGLYLSWRGGEWLLRRFIYENPAFAIHQIDVQTDGVIALEQIRRWAGVRLDDNLFALDLARVRRDLQLVPNIQSAAVERVLPHCLKIRVSEREPMAQFYFPQVRAAGLPEKGIYLLDPAGYVMPPLEAHQRAMSAPTNEHLPVLIGIPTSDLRPGRQVESAQVRAALSLIEAFERSPMAGVAELKEIDLTVPNLLLVATGQGSEVAVGLSDMDGQFRRWRAVYDYGQKAGKYVAWLDLSVANNVPARWLEAELVPPPPKVIKPPRTRKKHV